MLSLGPELLSGFEQTSRPSDEHFLACGVRLAGGHVLWTESPAPGLGRPAWVPSAVLLPGVTQGLGLSFLVCHIGVRPPRGASRGV